MMEGINNQEELEGWPLWYPGKSLRSIDLIGLENFLFSRFNYPEKGFGIVSLDESQIVATSSEDGKQITIEIKDIKGITKRGHYVQIDREGKKVSVDIIKGYDHIDLAIKVNKMKQEDNKKFKFYVSATFAQENNKYEHRKDSLYLGRYKCLINNINSNRNNIDFDLIKYPPVYTLFSISPRSIKWNDWIAPLVNKINQVIKSLKQRNVSDFSHNQIVALTQAYDIAYQWFEIPVPVLVYKLNYLNWLLKLLSENQTDIDASQILKKNEIELENNIWELPIRLSKMLESAIIIEPNKNVLQNEHHYSFDWVERTGNLEITFNDQHEPSSFQIHLDFTKTSDKTPDCENDIRTRLENEFGSFLIGPEIKKVIEEQKEVVYYQIDVKKNIEGKTKLILYSLSHKKPEITIKKNEL